VSGDSAGVLIGDGIGGLATGYALASAGHTVRLLNGHSSLVSWERGCSSRRTSLTSCLNGGARRDRSYRDAGQSTRSRQRGHWAELVRFYLEDAFRERYYPTYVVTHGSDVHGILLDRVPPRQDRASYRPHRRAGRDVCAWTRTYCIDGEVLESQAVLVADRLTSVLHLSIMDDGLICSSAAYRRAIPVTDVRTEVDFAGVVLRTGPGAFSSGTDGGEIVYQVAAFGSRPVVPTSRRRCRRCGASAEGRRTTGCRHRSSSWSVTQHRCHSNNWSNN
jgi:3-hydroxybenzoate 6-monooxygenase